MREPAFYFLHNLKLQSKLLLTYLLVALIPFILWSVYSYQQTNDYLVRQAADNFNTMQENTANSLNDKTKRVENALKLYAMDSTISQVLVKPYENTYIKYSDIRDKIDSFTTTVQMLYPEIMEITLYSSGDLAGTRIQFRQLDELDQTPIGLQLRETAGVVWRLEENELFAYANSINLYNAQKVGVVRFQVDYAQIFEQNVPVHLDDYRMLVLGVSDETLYQTEALSSPLGEGDCIRVESILEPTGWHLAMDKDMRAIRMAPGSAFTTTITAVGLSFFLILAMILFFSRVMTHRVNRLKQDVAGVVRNHFQTEIRSDYTDEIGEITNSVGAMVKETKVMIQEVYEREIQLREAEINALQAQINPHFLYNTLSMINWKAIASRNAEISQLVTTLSTFYRTTLNHGENITSVRDELMNTRAYLEIQHSLHNSSFDVSWEAADSILDYDMPNLILQPIVENAVEHGINKKRDGRGRIRITGYENGDDIIFEIADNGPGMTQELIREVLLYSKKGYGVKNVNDRLKLFFDEKYGLSFTCLPEGGTCVTVKLPRYIHIKE